ncbi:unnamed protein product, partial [Ilex paraguariensis]
GIATVYSSIPWETATSDLINIYRDYNSVDTKTVAENSDLVKLSTMRFLVMKLPSNSRSV